MLRVEHHQCSGWASLVAQRVKNLPAVQETKVPSLCREDPLEEEMATHSSIFAWRIPWTEVQFMGLQRVGHDTHTQHNLQGDIQNTQTQRNLQGSVQNTHAHTQHNLQGGVQNTHAHTQHNLQGSVQKQ